MKSAFPSFFPDEFVNQVAGVLACVPVAKPHQCRQDQHRFCRSVAPLALPQCYVLIDSSGTLPGQGCGFTYDGENEGHGGYLATNIASQNQLPPWLSATKPDIVIMTRE